jgi:hypothetical protein
MLSSPSPSNYHKKPKSAMKEILHIICRSYISATFTQHFNLAFLHYGSSISAESVLRLRVAHLLKLVASFDQLFLKLFQGFGASSIVSP